VHLLVLKEFVNKLAMHEVSNMKVYTNIFDKQWRLTEKAEFSSLVVGRDTNWYSLLLLISTSSI
jgi:hypothetical protein